jgi:hypothetical protein
VTSVTDQPHEASHCKTASVTVLSASTNAVETLLANTTNAGTRLIGKGAPLSGSVSFESEAGPLSTWPAKLFDNCRRGRKTEKIRMRKLLNDPKITALTKKRREWMTEGPQ